MVPKYWKKMSAVIPPIRSIVIIAVLAWGAASLWARGSANDSEKASGAAAGDDADQLIIGWDQDTLTFDPHRAYEMDTTAAIHAVYETLYRFGEDISRPIPHLAESHEVVDDVNYIFKLRRDVVFSNGAPFTAEDVEFSFERLKYLKSNTSFLADQITEVSVIDDYTVSVELTAPDAAFISKITSGGFSIIDKETAEARGAASGPGADTGDTAQEWLDGTSVGTGPYTLSRFTPDIEVVLDANPNYWNGDAAFDQVLFKHMPDTNTQRLMVQRGDIDIALQLTADQAAQMDDSESVQVLSAETMVFSFLLMNNDPEIGGPFADPLVREAIKYALDYEGYKLIAGPGAVTPVNVVQVGFLGALPPRDPGFRNLDRARELLARAGYPDGFSADVFAINYTFQGLNWVKLAEKVKADLGEIGIELEVVSQELTVGLDEYRGGKWSFAVTGWGPDYIDVNTQLAFLPGRKVGLRANWRAEDNPELAAMGEKAMMETDIAARERLIEEIQREIEKNSPFISIVQHPRQTVSGRDIEGAKWHEVYRIDVGGISRED